MILIVPIGDRHWLADVGFGADGARDPVPLDAKQSVQDDRVYRIAEEGELRVLQIMARDGWQDLYAFSTTPVYAVDFVVANWFTSTFPTSPFVTSLTAQRIRSDARHILRNFTYTFVRGDRSETREITRDEVVPLLRDTFGLDVPDDAQFRALDTPR
jgi:N-hydroxyarylamine O-acetyltransferase